MNNNYKDFIEARYGQDWKITLAEKVRVGILVRLAGSGKRILDIGCYDGTISKLLQNNNNKVIGTDLSNKAALIAKTKGITCIQSDVSQGLAFKNDTFDVVFAAEVIEHIFDLSFFMNEVKRVLKSNGLLILSTPNLASLGRRLCLLVGKNPLIEIENEEGSAGHIRYFVKDTFFELLLKYGFKIESFSSDVVNFDNSGKRFSRILARLFPGLGKSLITRAKNEK